MSEKLRGIIKVISATVQVSDKFSKREFVLTSDSAGMYPQDILFQCSQDKCVMLDDINIGDEVEVSYNLNGRCWTNNEGVDKYFTSLNAWKMDKI